LWLKKNRRKEGVDGKKKTIPTAVIEQTGDLDQRRMEFTGNQTAINRQKSSAAW